MKTCANCLKEIEDNVKFCPHCGAESVQPKPPVPKDECIQTENAAAAENTAENPAPETDSAVTENAVFQTEAQQAQTQSPPQINDMQTAPQIVNDIASVGAVKKKANKKVIAAAVGVFIVIAIISLVVGITLYHNKQVENYTADCQSMCIQMLSCSAQAEEAANLTTKVWYNAIWEESDSTTNEYTRYVNIYGYYKYYDFNTALANLFADDDFSQKISSIEATQSSISKQMKDMANPPSKCEDMYAAFKEYYDAFVSFTNLVTSKGAGKTYKEYSSALSEADDNLINCYDKIKIYF